MSLLRTSGVTGYAAADVLHVFTAAQLNSSPSTDSVSPFQFNRQSLATQDWQITEFVSIPLHRHGTANTLAAYANAVGFLGDISCSADTPSIWNNNVTLSQYGLVVNGTVGTTTAFTYPTGGSAEAVGYIAFGHQASDTSLRSWNGPIGEYIIYAGLMSIPQRQRMEGYLAWKWGLAHRLDGQHRFKNRPPLIGD